MAVTSITERIAERRSSSSWNGRNYSRNHTRAFTVLTDDFNDGPQAARLADLSSSEPSGSRIPRIGERYPTDRPALCVSADPSPINGDPFAFIVLCRYTTTPSSASGGNFPSEIIAANPLQHPFAYSISSVRVQVTVTRDKDGKPIENSAGEPYDPPIEEEESRSILTVRKNLPFLGSVEQMLIDISFIKDTINAKAWGGVGPHQAKLVAVDADLTLEAGVRFWAMRYEIHLLHGIATWDRVILDQGFMAFAPPPALPGLAQNIIDPQTGSVVASPVKLDGAGNRLAPGGEPVYRTFETRDELDFTDLDLGI